MENKKIETECFCICHHQDKMLEHDKETPKSCEHCSVNMTKAEKVVEEVDELLNPNWDADQKFMFRTQMYLMRLFDRLDVIEAKIDKVESE